MNNCTYYSELISAYFDNELDTELEAKLMAHIETCDECKDRLDFYSELRERTGELIVSPPVSLADGIMNEIRARRKGWKRFVPHAVSLAAVISLVFASQSGIFGDFFINQRDDSAQSPPAIETADYTMNEAGEAKDDSVTGSDTAKMFSAVAAVSDAPESDKNIDDATSDTSGQSDVVYIPEPEQSVQPDAETSGGDIMLAGGEADDPAAEDHPSDVVTPFLAVLPIGDDDPGGMQEGFMMPRMFSLPQTVPTFSEDGRIDILGAGEISFITVNDGDNSSAVSEPDEIADIAAWLDTLVISPDDEFTLNGGAVVEYVITYTSGGVLAINYAPDVARIYYGGVWYAIETGQSDATNESDDDDALYTEEEALNFLFDYLFPDKSFMSDISLEVADSYCAYVYSIQDTELTTTYGVEYIHISSDGQHYIFRLYESVYHDGAFSHTTTRDFYAVNRFTGGVIAERGQNLPDEWNAVFPW